MLLGAILFALTAFTSANVVTSNSFSRMSSSRTDFANGQSQRQWTVGRLTCYVASDNGMEVRQCRNGPLGTYHDMTPEEEAIIRDAIGQEEEQRAEFNARMAEAADNMGNSMRQMQSQMDAGLGNMQNMINAMHQQMREQFGAFG